MVTIYEKRRMVLQTHARENNIDTVVITSPANIFYYSGFNSDPHERFMALFIDVKKEAEFLFVPLLDKESAMEVSDIVQIIPISDEEEPFAIVRNTVGETIGRTGIEASSFSYGYYRLLKKFFSQVEVTDISGFTAAQRMKKSKDEVLKIKQAIEIIEKVLAEGIKKAAAGMTESELAGEMEYLMRKHGASGPSFSTIVLFGERAALPHGQPGERELQEGDCILIDMGVIKDGYCSDITRTFFFGSATDRQQKIYDIVLESNQAGINAVKAGAVLKMFDSEARKVIHDQGYSEFFNNRVGHGLGIEVHEQPSIHGKNMDAAEPGLVFTIEPGIYIPGKGGVRIEDIVYINDEGEKEVLTSFSRKLQII